MYNLVYFEKKLIDLNSKAMQIYLESIKNGIIHNPIIFCDSYNFMMKDIPIFHTFYITNTFHKKIILVNKFDLEYLIDIGITKNIIVIYDSVIDSLPNYKDSYDYNTNGFNKFIKEKYDEKIQSIK